MAFKNPSPDNADKASQADLAKFGPTKMYSRCKLPSNASLVLNDIINMFSFGTTENVSIMGVTVYMEQVDTGGTVAFKIGYCDETSGVYDTLGLKFGDNVTTLGRTTDVSIWAPSNANFIKRPGSGFTVGIQVTTLPTTPVWANKEIIMVLDVIPSGMM